MWHRRKRSWTDENALRSVLGLMETPKWRSNPKMREEALIVHVADLLGWQRRRPPRWRFIQYRRWRLDRPSWSAAVLLAWQKYGIHGVNCRHSWVPMENAEPRRFGA